MCIRLRLRIQLCLPLDKKIVASKLSTSSMYKRAVVQRYIIYSSVAKIALMYITIIEPKRRICYHKSDSMHTYVFLKSHRENITLS